MRHPRDLTPLETLIIPPGAQGYKWSKSKEYFHSPTIAECMEPLDPGRMSILWRVVYITPRCLKNLKARSAWGAKHTCIGQSKAKAKLSGLNPQVSARYVNLAYMQGPSGYTQGKRSILIQNNVANGYGAISSAIVSLNRVLQDG